MGKVKEHKRSKQNEFASVNQPLYETLTLVDKSNDNGKTLRNGSEFVLKEVDDVLDYCRERILQYYSQQKTAPS